MSMEGQNGTHLRSDDVHAVAAGIEQLLQLDEALHLLPSTPADDGCRKQTCHCPHCCPHLHKHPMYSSLNALSLYWCMLKCNVLETN